MIWMFHVQAIIQTIADAVMRGCEGWIEKIGEQIYKVYPLFKINVEALFRYNVSICILLCRYIHI
jgi:hypothetical protein